MVKNIAILGSFGTGNIGDEAAWIAVKQFFVEKNIEYKYHTNIFHWSWYYLPCGYQINEFFQLTDSEIEYMNKNFSALIIVGGGIIGEKWGLITMPRFDEIINKLTIPIYSISISADKIVNNLNERISSIGFLKNKSKIFTVRDEYSKKNLEDLGFKNIEITPDIVTTLTCEHKSSKKTFGTNIIGTVYSNLINDDFININFWKKLKENITDFKFITFGNQMNDIAGAQFINGDMRTETYRTEEMLFLLKDVKFIIAGKLHACVLAAINGTPFFAINYHPKVKAFCDSINYPYYYPKENNLPVDETGYGYDLKSFDFYEMLRLIMIHKNNPKKPKIPITANYILERMWSDLNG
jgi:polysaccharide pyruvyl transferase WcaK-like protein